MLFHEELHRKGLNNYKHILAYCKGHHIQPSFETRNAKILLQEIAADAGTVDILIYVLDSSAEIPPTKTEVEYIKARNVIIVVNKMYTMSI